MVELSQPNEVEELLKGCPGGVVDLSQPNEVEGVAERLPRWSGRPVTAG